MAYPSAGIIECNDDGTGNPSCTFYMGATTQKPWWPAGAVSSGGGCSGGEIDIRSENIPAEARASVSTPAPSAVAGVSPVEAAVATSEVSGVAQALEALASVPRQHRRRLPKQLGSSLTPECSPSAKGPPAGLAPRAHSCTISAKLSSWIPTVPRRILRPNARNASRSLGHDMRRKCGRKTNPKRPARLKGSQ